MKRLIRKLNIGQKVQPCGFCGKKLRFPVRPGKKLKISCPHCSGQMIVQFKTPWGQMRDGMTLARPQRLLMNLLGIMVILALVFVLMNSKRSDPESYEKLPTTGIKI